MLSSAVVVKPQDWGACRKEERLEARGTINKIGVATPHFETVVKIAGILEVSLDTLAGRSEKDDSPAIHNAKLHELYKKANELPDEEQQALIILLDSLIARATLGRLVGESQKLRG